MNEEVKEEIEALMSIYEDDMEGKTMSLKISTVFILLNSKLIFQFLKSPLII